LEPQLEYHHHKQPSHLHRRLASVLVGWGYPYILGGGYGYGYGGYSPYGYGYGNYDDSGYGYGYGGSGYGDRSRVVELQRRLARAGYYHGAIDGIMGSQTRRAIRVFERSRGELSMR
jgi:hypothetical protein